MPRQLSFADAINEGLQQAMEKDPKTLCFGLGVDDPKRIFGTTKGLVEDFGSDRVFDMPTSENGMTGIAIGAAINGHRPIMTHQRLDFFLLAMDQLVNNAAKWQYMFGGNSSPVPLTIRLVVGRGWGQGPTHSQNLHSWFMHVPGLKVVMPTTPADAKGMLLASIFDDNPTLFIEHRWLHQSVGEVPEEFYTTELGKAQIRRPGKDITVVSLSYMTIEMLRGLEALENTGIDPEIIDVRSVQPFDWDCVLNSVKKTGRLLVLDTANESCSMASEVVARVSADLFPDLRCAPQRVCLTDHPSPTSYHLTKSYYMGTEQILSKINQMMGTNADISTVSSKRGQHHDVPGDWFKGPF